MSRPDFAHRNDHLRYVNGQATGWDDSENTSPAWSNAYKDYVGWASASKLAEPFRKNNADHLRIGERLRLVAINRASGYIGSTTFTSKDPGQASGDWTAVDQSDAINSAINDIVMTPPNLKIWAERVHEIQQGRQVAGEAEHTNIIGNEGITLEDDLAVAIHTEWLDTDGRPFPAEMGDYGYTARLAKITRNPTPYEDALQQNTTHEFSIRPGRNLNVLQFNQQELTRHHYYVQVNPYPISEQNDFGRATYNPSHQNASNNDEEDIHHLPSLDITDGNQSHPLRYRPAHYVPIQVPIFDEVATQIQQDFYNETVESNSGAGLTKPSPLYRWVYRPELQLSQYSFDAQSLIVTQTPPLGEQVTENINLNDEDARFFSLFDDYTDSVELLFDLIGPELDSLPPLENDREFVLSLGAEEVVATIGADGIIIFDNPEHLKALTSDDLLTLRLYLNGDAGNILWQQNFGIKGIRLTTSEDEGSQEAHSFIICTQANKDKGICELQKPIRAELITNIEELDSIVWKVEALKGNMITDDLSSGSDSSNSTNKPYMYGQTNNQKSSAFGGISTGAWNPLGGSGTGRYETEFVSSIKLLNEANHFSFTPDMGGAEYQHLPASYNSPDDCAKQYSACMSGTNMTDIWRHNPHVGYKITAIVNGEDEYSAIVKMDHTDVLRQEYINHLSVSSDAYGKGVRVPTRDLFLDKATLSGGDWVPSDYPYSVLFSDGHMEPLWQGVSDNFETYRSNDFSGFNNITFSVPNNQIKVTSAYRNPERNERVGGASASWHMVSRAVDIGFRDLPYPELDTPVNERGLTFGPLWRMMRDTNAVPSANMFQLEGRAGPSAVQLRSTGTGGNSREPDILNDDDEDGIPNEYELSYHLHLQDQN